MYMYTHMYNVLDDGEMYSLHFITNIIPIHLSIKIVLDDGEMYSLYFITNIIPIHLPQYKNYKVVALKLEFCPYM